MTRLYLVELRRSPVIWFLPVLVVLELAMMFGRSTEWIGIWPQASAAVQRPVVYLAPISAVLAAWAAGRTHRSHMCFQLASSARPRWMAECALLAANSTYCLIPLALGAIAAYFTSVGRAGPGFLWPSYLLLGFALVVINVALGHIIGSLLTGKMSGPIVALAASAFVLVWSSMSLEPTLYAVSGSPRREVVWTALALRVILALLLFVAASVLPKFDRVTTAQRGALSFSAVAIIAVFVLASPTLRQDRPAPTLPLCTETTIVVCMWPEHHKYMGAAAAMAERAAHALPDVLDTPTVAIYEMGVGSANARSRFALDLHPWTLASALAVELWHPHVGSCMPNQADEDQYYSTLYEVDSMLTALVYGDGMPTDLSGGWPVDWAAIESVLSSDQPTQSGWLSARFAKLKSLCVV